MTAPVALLIVVLAGVAALAAHRPGLALGCVLAAPLFFEISSHGIALGHSILAPRRPLTLPVSVFAAPIFAPLAWEGLLRLRSGRPDQRRIDVLVMAFAGWAVIAFVYGYAERSARPLVAAQVVTPLYFFLVGKGMADEREELRDLARGFVAVTTGIAVLVAVSSAVFGRLPGLSDNRLGDRLIGDLYIFQAWDYFPLLLTLGALLAFGLFIADGRDPRFGAAAAVLAMVTVGLYSRGGVLTLAAGIALIAVLLRRALPRHALVIGAVVGVGLIGASAAAGFAATQRIFDSAPFLGNKQDKALVDESNRVRLDATQVGLRQIKANPIFGEAMSPSEIDPVTGLSKTVNAHNQYVDYAVRGGVPLALLFLGVIGATLLRLRAAQSRWRFSALAGIGALAAVTVVSNFTQVNFVQALTAFPLWLAVGVVAAVPLEVPRLAAPVAVPAASLPRAPIAHRRRQSRRPVRSRWRSA
jgi:O-antigen ligase